MKKNILVFTGYYLPGYKAGGPIRTIANMVELLGDEFEFFIITGDRDSGETEPYSQASSQKKWLSMGKAKVLYLAPEEKTLKNIISIIRNTPHDVLYLNSFFGFNASVKPLIAKYLGFFSSNKVVVAPRGEFSEGALGLKRHKKYLFIFISKVFGFHKNIIWQASSIREKNDILRVFGKEADAIKIAINLPDTSSKKLAKFTARSVEQPLRIVFLSRISPMKNLDYALEVLKNVEVPILFDIYGTNNDKDYFDKCMELVKQLPSNVECKYKGLVNHTNVVNVLSQYDLFFLPTKGENYGHVILESLSSGTPVLIADTTPWLDLKEKGVGWALSLNKTAGFIEKIEFMYSLTEAQQLAMRDKVISYANSHLFNQEHIEQNRQLFS